VNPEEELQRAREAQSLMDHALFQQAREDLYGKLQSLRRVASPTQTDLHTKLILMEQLADQFFGFFEQIGQTGLFAKDFMDQTEKRNRGFAERLSQYVAFGRNRL
jgi:hypothetical protein